MFWLQALLSLLSGAAFSAAFPPIGLWWLAVAFVPLFIVTARAERPRDAFGFGFWFAVGFFAFHIFWLPNSLSDFFGPAAWAIYPLIILAEGVFWGLVTFLSRFIAGKSRNILWLLPAFWLLMEWARTQGPLAFPWGSLGYIWIATPVAQLADIAGSYGLSFFTLVLVALTSLPFLPEDDPSFLYSESSQSPILRFAPILAVFFLALGSYTYGFYRLTQLPPEPNETALLVQGNTDPLGRAQGNSTDLDVYTSLTQTALSQLDKQPALVIWPEGAVIGNGVVVEGMNGEETRTRISNSANNSDVITGASAWVSTPEGFKNYNAVYSISNAVVRDRYDKIYLVPFGEGLPLANALQFIYRPIYASFGLSPFGRTAGTTLNPLPTSTAIAASYICYESVFPQVSAAMVRQGANVLVNISNDAWFGKGNGAEQHFLMGSMRAIETRRYILRAGNDGITAVINPHGKVLERLERGIAGSLEADYALSNVITPYVRFGDLLITLIAIYSVLVSALIAIRR